LKTVVKLAVIARSITRRPRFLKTWGGWSVRCAACISKRAGCCQVFYTFDCAGWSGYADLASAILGRHPCM